MTLLAMAPHLVAPPPTPAGGASLSEILISGGIGAVLAAALALFGIAHRKGSTTILTRLGRFSERVSGLPAWAALPAAIAGGSLLIAVYGFYWDVSIHIDNGRDPGPFANAAHYFIIAGLLGIALAGYVAILLGSNDDTPSAVTVGASIMGKGWKVPVGGVLLLACGGIAVLGFPLDDMWHRLFGQDVTLWSPTHMQMVGGAALSTLALWILLSEARPKAKVGKLLNRFQGPLLAGAFLVGLSAFQAEFDYSVPQFRLLFQPILLMLSAGAALVPARICLGRGGALKSVAVFLAIRGTLTLVIGPILGHTLLHFPLYIVEALLVEAVALKFSPQKQITFGAIAGLAIGTVGLGAEWLWSHIWMTISWPASLLPEALFFGVLAGVVGGLLGAYIGRSLSPAEERLQSGPRWLGPAVAAGVLFCLAYPFPTNSSLEANATIALTKTSQPGWVDATIALDPPDTAANVSWFDVTAWQGGGSRVRDLIPTGPGTYRTSGPIPVTGDWKTLIRLQDGPTTMAVPIYLPLDPGIPAPEVPAKTHMTRPFIADKKIVLREAKNVSGALTYGASFVLGGIFLLWVVILWWGMHRLKPTTGRLPAPLRGARRHA
jgi:hypothetical protein